MAIHTDISETSEVAAITSTGWAICYAHRGARGHAPENTLLAFDLAFDLGADAIECDVQRSADGQLVIIHDGVLNRTTNGRGLVSAQSFAALRALDASRAYRPYRLSGARRIVAQIPTLDETLALVRRRGGALNLEIKGESVEESVATAETVAPVLRALPDDDPLRERLLVSSFEHPAVRLLKERLPWLRVAALFSGREWRPETMLATARELGAEAIHPGVNLTSAALIRQAHEQGLRVNIWTANSPSTIRQLLLWGANGLFSDYPERVIIERAWLAWRQTGE